MVKIIVAFIFIAVSIGLLFGFVKPTFDNTQMLLKNTAQYDKALSKAREVQELKRSLLSQYNIFAGDNLPKLEKLLPDHVDNVRLIMDIDGMASLHGIRISGVNVLNSVDSSTDVQTGSAIGFSAAAKVSKKYESVVLEFRTVSSYSAFKSFLRDLERSLRVVDLVSLDVAQAPAAKAGPNDPVQIDQDQLYTFDVGIKTYWLK